MKDVESIQSEKTNSASPLPQPPSPLEEIKSNITLIERAVSTLEPRFTHRVLRSLTSLRRCIDVNVIRETIAEVYVKGALYEPCLFTYIAQSGLQTAPQNGHYFHGYRPLTRCCQLTSRPWMLIQLAGAGVKHIFLRRSLIHPPNLYQSLRYILDFLSSTASLTVLLVYPDIRRTSQS